MCVCVYHLYNNGSDAVRLYVTMLFSRPFCVSCLFLAFLFFFNRCFLFPLFVLWGTAALPGQTRLHFLLFLFLLKYILLHDWHLQLHENEMDWDGCEEWLAGRFRFSEINIQPLKARSESWARRRRSRLLAHPSNDRRNQTRSLNKPAYACILFLVNMFFPLSVLT